MAAYAAWLLLGAASAWGLDNPAAAQAYEALKQKNYDQAIEAFRQAIQLQPERLDLRRELAYTLLKTGDTEQARELFSEIVRLAPSDWHSALEYGYLCYETRRVLEARRVFDRIRKQGEAAARAAAEQAFQRVDAPLAEAISRWSRALTQNPGDYSAHVELAKAAADRDDWKTAAEHFLRAWKLRPVDRQLLVYLGQARKQLGDLEGAHGAWVAAAWGPQPRAAEKARDFLPKRYPYASEFRRALELDHENLALRRDLAYLYLAVHQTAEAEKEFRALVEQAPADLLSAAQLGFLLLARGERQQAMPYLNRVLESQDAALIQRVQEALRQTGAQPGAPSPTPTPHPTSPSAASPTSSLPSSPPPSPGSSSPPPAPPAATPPTSHAPAVEPSSHRSLSPGEHPKLLGDKSYEAGYLRDALRYYELARNENPTDPETNLKLGYTYNMLGQDAQAVRYFKLARKTTNAQLRAEAERAWRNLRPSVSRFRTTAWFFPMFSSRWHTAFTYGQIKTDMRVGKLPLRPYLSTRLVADLQRSGGRIEPQYLSESSLIFGLGLATSPWRGLMGWAEAGSAVRYRERSDIGRAVADYRAGLNWSRGFGPRLSSTTTGFFFDPALDLVLLSRFRWNLLFYSQNRAGLTWSPVAGLESQLVWNLNLTADRNREHWANFLDIGPGIRFRTRRMPPGLVFSLDLLRGHYLLRQGNPFGTSYYDVRAAFWYAVTR
ncbi:MAG: tetratricopeptide repeat protein [Bryobacteraceae bacterium]|nr:tetratricopeptide repeat protein [Bryobacteraceae bacterium]MDW8376960.1 tetratricopeptide repeat protein [Bryobacterales bacterium]